jgi:hypothetical protein
MEEIAALFSICLLTEVGWLAAKLFFARIISDENRIYFAPALGAGSCALVAYVAVHSYQPWIIDGFCLAAAVSAILFRKRLRGRSAAPQGINLALSVSSSDGTLDPARLFRFTALGILALYVMQIVVYGLFSRIYPGPDEVWSLFNMTGVSPPDQMFAWHQAMYADQHRHYPQDPFYRDMDFYDRPQLGGYITLFFFKLFRLPLTEDHYLYPADSLRFYHCLWWLLNNLYVAGVAPLFRKLFGHRGAILAVGTTALGGIFFLASAGGWMKFAAAYPFLLALLLYLESQGPALQASLCAMSYYIHGSILPFLAGFGLLQIFNIRYPVIGQRLRAQKVGVFAAVGVILVGAWFVVVRWAGSRQPLFYYYFYNAGLTEAQTKSIADLANAFYNRHTWASVSIFPVRSLLGSWGPLELFRSLKEWLTGAEPITWHALADLSFRSQRFCVECALGLVAAPIVIAGIWKSLAREHAGKIALALYLVPTILVALFYRIDWAFSLHVLVPYHALCLFGWVTVLRSRSIAALIFWLTMVALEGVVCVLFADSRFLPVKGLDLGKIPAEQLWWLGAYLALLLSILLGTVLELKHALPDEQVREMPAAFWRAARVAGLKLVIGLGIVAAVIGIYSVYCLRFYPR